MSVENGPDRSELSAFLDGQLPPADAERLAAAMETDPELRAEVASLEATRNLLKGLPRESAPDGMLDAIIEQVERNRLLHAATPVHESRPLRWVGRLATAAIILLTVGLGIFLHTQLNENDWVEQQELASRPRLAWDITDAEAEAEADDRLDKAAPTRPTEAAPPAKRKTIAPPPDDGALLVTAGKAASPRTEAASPANNSSPAEGLGGMGMAAALEAKDLPSADPRQARGRIKPSPPVMMDKVAADGDRMARVGNTEQRLSQSTPPEPDATVVLSPGATHEAPSFGAHRRLAPESDDAGVATGMGMGMFPGRGGREFGGMSLDDMSFMMGQRMTSVRCVTLNAPDVEAATAEVEALLLSNSIIPIDRGDTRRGHLSRSNVYTSVYTRTSMPARANTYTNIQVSNLSNRIVLYVDEAQAPAIEASLNAIGRPKRGRQVAVAAAKDDQATFVMRILDKLLLRGVGTAAGSGGDAKKAFGAEPVVVSAPVPHDADDPFDVAGATPQLASRPATRPASRPATPPTRPPVMQLAEASRVPPPPMGRLTRIEVIVNQVLAPTPSSGEQSSTSAPSESK